MSIRSKILIPMTGLAIVSAMVIGFIGIYNLRTLTSANEHAEAVKANMTAQSYLKQLQLGATGTSQLAAKDHDIIAALAEYKNNKDRKQLADAALAIAQNSDIEFLIITDDKGNVIVRTNSLAEFGDNIGEQNNVKAALSGRQHTTIETGTHIKLALRCGTPVVHQGKVIGAASAGYRFDENNFVDDLKSLSQAEVTVFLGDMRISTTVLNDKGNRNIGTKAQEHISKQVLGGKDYIGGAVVAGKKMYSYYAPLKDAEGRILGMIFAGVDIRNTEKYMNDTVRTMAIIIVLFCIGATVTALKISGSISGALKELSRIAKSLAAGDTDISLSLTADNESKDETRQLAASFKDLIEANREHIDLVTVVAAGDVTCEVRPRSDRDRLSYALIDMIESTKKQIAVMEQLADGDLTGEITPRSGRDSMGAAIRKTVEKLNHTMVEIRNSADHVTSASKQISGGAQALAESSNVQASSLEEVSSSLEEMSSMTKQNADYSNQGKAMVGQVVESLREADVSMKRMAESITHIKNSSDNTAKILKTINDIAFQTNLLALNAAVEAARAGEAGKGFAVVAEEVRNLAMRCAEAARNTAEMIEVSIMNADEGVRIADEVEKRLTQTSDRAGKVNAIIAEIAAGNGEQAQGIEQVNTAVAQMNQTTQQNAANSEESASAAEQLNSQAMELSGLVGNFRLDRRR